MKTGLCCLAVALLCLDTQAVAHTPHHVIDDLVVSPDYENDATLFILVHNYLLRSGDRGASWRPLVNGIDTPHILTDIAISPEFARDGLAFLATDGGGIYRSADRGESWRRFNDGLRQVRFGRLFMIATAHGPVVLAAGSSRGLFVSSADSAKWQRAMSDDVQITALYSYGSGESAYFLAGDSGGGIWRSEGDLRHWQRIVRLEDAGAVTSFAHGEPRQSKDAWLVGTERAGLLLLTDDGRSRRALSNEWPQVVENCKGDALPAGIPDQHIRDIESSVDGREIVVTTWHKAVRVSTDGGDSWALLDRGLRCNVQADALSFRVPHFRDLEITRGQRADWFVASFEGLYRSEDEGRSWVPFETMPVSLIRGMAVSPAIGDGHQVALTTYGGGAYIGNDGARTWTIANHGLVSTRLADAGFATGASGDLRLFGLSREHLLERGSEGWTANSLVYRGWRRSVGSTLERLSPRIGKSLFLDDSERHGMWPMQIEMSPSFNKDGLMLLGFRRKGIWRSEDSGASWDRDWQGPRDYVTDLVISPEFPKDGTAFAAIRAAGLYATRDTAVSWQSAGTGFDFLADFERSASPNHFIDPPLSRALTDSLLAISPGFATDRTVFAGSAAGLYRSTDRGQTWQPLSLPLRSGNPAVIGLGISPGSGGDNMLLVSIRGSGLFMSSDGGETFAPTGRDLLRANADIRYIGFSPTFVSDGIVYGASDWELYVSRDRGESWVRVDRPVRYEDWRGSSPGPVWFSADWARETGPAFSGSTQTVSNRPGATATLNFHGGAVTWFGERGPSGGMARISIDGDDAGTVDLYSDAVNSSTLIFSVEGLPDTPHNVVIEILDSKSPASAGHRVTVDNLDVSGGAHD